MYVVIDINYLLTEHTAVVFPRGYEQLGPQGAIQVNTQFLGSDHINVLVQSVDLI